MSHDDRITSHITWWSTKSVSFVALHLFPGNFHEDTVPRSGGALAVAKQSKTLFEKNLSSFSTLSCHLPCVRFTFGGKLYTFEQLCNSGLFWSRSRIISTEHERSAVSHWVNASPFRNYSPTNTALCSIKKRFWYPAFGCRWAGYSLAPRWTVWCDLCRWLLC